MSSSSSSSSSEANLATAKTILSTAASVAAAAVVIRSISQDLILPEFQDYISSAIRNLFSKFSSQITLVIQEFDGLVNNELYVAAEAYLGSKISPTTRRFRVSRPEKEKHFTVTMERGEEIIDVCQGQKFRWAWICTKTEAKKFRNPRDLKSTLNTEVRSFELTFHKKNRDFVVNSYLPYITNQAEQIKQEKRTIRIFTADYNRVYRITHIWKPVTFDHPSTFDTLAMDPVQKDMIVKDLDRFLRRKEYYRQVGKAWKRGYLLYGPPGTGKSSLIAAIANYLNFDVYDLELTEVKRNSDLRKVLLGTANKSILVVEDIDCTIDFQEKLAKRTSSNSNSTPEVNEEKSRVTLSGLLNFVDGLWSSCGDERIIIFTTNHVENLDPALVRPGRMDVHINVSYCTPGGFKVLALNYLRLNDHVRFREIQDLIQNVKVTPAEVAEQLLKDEDPDVALEGLINFIHRKTRENEEAKSEEKSAALQKNEAKENGETEVELISL